MTAVNRRARKVATNLSIRGDLVSDARALGLTISTIVEAALEQAVAEARRSAWLAENEGAIDAYNAKVAARGVFSDGRRRF